MYHKVVSSVSFTPFFAHFRAATTKICLEAKKSLPLDTKDYLIKLKYCANGGHLGDRLLASKQPKCSRVAEPFLREDGNFHLLSHVEHKYFIRLFCGYITVCI